MLFNTLIILVLLSIAVESKTPWSYEAARKWSRTNRYCAGHVQSPIDVRHNISHYDRRLRPMFFDDQNAQETSELMNSGHTVQLNLKGAFVLKHVAPQSEDYNVEQLHFHWGRLHDDKNGSEHRLDGESYPLEMHVVTYSSLFSTIREAMSNIRGLAVVGFFFKISEEANPLLQPIVNGLTHVHHAGEHFHLKESFNLKGLAGKERMHKYYRYDGSLTTPPCFESVIWSVVLDPIPISIAQLNAFQHLRDEKAKLMENTYRPIQSLGTRKLFRSFIDKDKHDRMNPGTFNQQKSGISIVAKMNVLLIIAGVIGTL